MPEFRRALTGVSRHCTELYERLEEETGQATGFRRVGSLTVANTEQRMIELKRGVSMARFCGMQADVQARKPELWPL